MKILITGGNGFLGKHVIKELEKFSHTLMVPTSKELNLLDRNQTVQFVQKVQPTSILHMAALCGGILANKKSPADFLHHNIDMSSNIFTAAKNAGCTQIYTLGSVCSYPKYCPTPFCEDDLWNGYPEETNAPYGMAKRVLLMMSQTYKSQYNFTGAHLIPVNLYGEFDHFDDLENSHVIPALINKFENARLNNLPQVMCWGTGESTREFLYAGDAAQAIAHAVSSNFDSELPINLGTGKQISIKQLALLIKKLTGYTGDIVFTGEVSNGQPERQLNVNRAKELLNWVAPTSLEVGLQKSIDWYRLRKS